MRAPSSRARRSSLVALTITVAVGLLSGGCANSDGASGDAPTTTEDHSSMAGMTTTIPFDVADSEFVDMTGQTDVTITVVDNTFEPRYVIVSPGTKVVWKNEGRNLHNVVPGAKGAFEGTAEGSFTPGASHIVTFAVAGDFPYFCSIHGTMRNGQNGAIRVAAEK